MKREYNKEINSEPIDIFIDMPLSYGDLKDHISGNSIGNHFTYDQNLQSYIFYQNGTSESSCPIITGLTTPFINPYNPNFIREFDFIPYYSGYGNIQMLGHQTNIGYGANYEAILNRGWRTDYGSTASGSQAGSNPEWNYLPKGVWYHIKDEYLNGVYKCYINNTLKYQGTYSTINNSRLSNSKLYLLCSNWSNGNDSKIALKNLIYYKYAV